MLSDACSEFVNTIADKAKDFAKQVHWYASPQSSFDYGEEIDALRRACAKVARNPNDIDAIVELVRLAESVRRFHDTPPIAPESAEREKEMLALVEVLRTAGAVDGGKARRLAEGVEKDGEDGKKAAKELSSVLKRLSRPAYEAAIKIITDIGSATAKHFLGL